VRRRLTPSFLLLTLLAATDAGAVVRCVRPGGGGGCGASINAEVALALPGDTVRVAAGVYTEYVFVDRNVVLEGGWDAGFTSRDPLNVTVVRPPDPDFSVVDIEGTFGDPAASTPVLDGFTITGGGGGNHGGGLRIRDSNAVVRNNVITGNVAFLLGGGVWVQRGAPRLEGNRIELNRVDGLGGGVQLEDTRAVLVGNRIAGNTLFDGPGSGGGVDAGGGTVTLRGNVILDNDTGGGTGGGVAIRFGMLRVENTIVARNLAVSGGGIHGDATSTIVLVNDTIAANGAEGVRAGASLTLVNSIVTGHGVGVTVGPGVPVTAAFNDFFANTTNAAGFVLGASNLFVDPLLTGDFHLTAASPLVDAGTTAGAPRDDVDGEPRPARGPSDVFKVDIGADERPGDPQRHVDAAAGEADLTVVGPGNPPENPTSNGSNDYIGYSVLADDVSGDGRPDLVVAAEDWAEDFDTLNASGRLFGLFNTGERRTGVVDLLATAADVTVVSRLVRQHLGSDLVGGDLDGDGVRDLVIGSFENDNVPNDVVFPTVFVLRGPLVGPVRTLADLGDADFRLRAPAQDFFAFAAKNALATGDLDGDGIDDLAVGDALADDGANADAGAIFAVFGRKGLEGLHDLATTPADLTVWGPAAGAGLGALAIGRLGPKGDLDLVVRSADTAHVLFGLHAADTRRLGDKAADVTITGLEDGGVVVVDLTGDGQDDLVLGSGKTLLVLPGPFDAGERIDAASRAALVLTDVFAGSLATGDVTGSPAPDLLVGDGGRRRAWVVPGGVGLMGTFAIDEVAPIVVSGATLPFLGFDVAAGDLDLDGRADLVVGTKGVDVAAHGGRFVDAGTVYVVYGDPPPVPPTTTTTSTSTTTSSSSPSSSSSTTTSSSSSSSTTSSTSSTSSSSTSSTSAPSSTIVVTTTTTTSSSSSTTNTPSTTSSTSTTAPPLPGTSTTTSTAPPSPPTTTSTLPCTPAACDDGDPCTADGCAPTGVCANIPATDFDAVTCVFEGRGLRTPLCAKVPKSLERLLGYAQTLAGRAAAASKVGRARRLVRQEVGALKAAGKRLRAARRKDDLTGECLAELERLVAEARRRAEAWLGSS
jgi:hypothetical protein